MKHGVRHKCPYCRWHMYSSGTVPSISDDAFIAMYNLVFLLNKFSLGIEAAQQNNLLTKLIRVV